jgi:hypothetical protein
MGYSRSMPYRRADAEYLREKAAAFRRIAAGFKRPDMDKLLELAGDLEAKADEIEQRPDPRLPI